MAAFPPSFVQDQLAPGETPASSALKVRVLGAHLQRQLARHRASADGGRPLFVGMQGPQGCGKTTLCEGVQSYLASLPDTPVRCVVLSLDDLYLPFAELEALRLGYPDNVLLAGRGLPGTHDAALAESVLGALRSINAPSSGQVVRLPIFDKSLHGGRGDRSVRTVDVEGPVDVFVLEGWSMGFAALGDGRLAQRYAGAVEASQQASSPAGDRPSFLAHRLEHLAQLDRALAALGPAVYASFDAFIQVVPSSLSHILAWRTQQEHAMKRANGGRGMSDAEVEAFVERYLPGYELWAEGVRAPDAAWAGRGVALRFGAGREVEGVEGF